MKSSAFLTAIPTLTLLVAAVGARAQDEPGPLEQSVPVADEVPETAEPDPGPSDDEQLRDNFARYKDLMANGVLDEADTVAKRIVELTIRMNGPQSTETAKALTNLAIVQHRNKQYDSAQQNFEASIEIIEDVEDRLSTSLVNPLKGLGASQLEGGRPDLAAGTFTRAVHVTHVNDGPHNMAQVEILESLAETNYRLGLLDDVKKAHDRIYALNRRYFDSQPMALVQPLMRRASWQHRTGHYNDERATYRAVIRIIESQTGKDDYKLVRPLLKLGESYYFVDLTDSQPYAGSTMTSGEVYFKRAHRIAEGSADADWQTLAAAKLALADFYLSQASQGRARSLYGEAWAVLSAEDSRVAQRYEQLQVPVPLRFNSLPDYVGNAKPADMASQTEQLLTGTVAATFDISQRGRVSQLKITAATPEEFTDMQKLVSRELRGRLYRPALDDGVPIESAAQEFEHTFYYRESDLETLRRKAEAEAQKTN